MKTIDCLLALKHKVENSMGWPVRGAKFYQGKYWDEAGTMVISCDEATVMYFANATAEKLRTQHALDAGKIYRDIKACLPEVADNANFNNSEFWSALTIAGQKFVDEHSDISSKVLKIALIDCSIEVLTDL